MPVKKTLSTGFTLIELIITISIFTIISSLVVVSLTTSHHQANINSAIDTLVADLSQQQNKSMVGESTTGNYGIHFESKKYVLINGTSDNFDVALDGTLEFTTPGDITFKRGDGTVSGLTTITIKDTTSNTSRTITLNSYGIITQIN